MIARVEICSIEGQAGFVAFWVDVRLNKIVAQRNPAQRQDMGTTPRAGSTLLPHHPCTQRFRGSIKLDQIVYR